MRYSICQIPSSWRHTPGGLTVSMNDYWTGATHRSPVPLSPRQVQRVTVAPLLTEADQSKQTPLTQFAMCEGSSGCQCQAPGTRLTAATAPAACSRYHSTPIISALI